MGNQLGAANVVHLEHGCTLIEGFIALDGSSNVIGIAPTAAPPGAGPYTVCKGLTSALGVAGAVVNQPHISTGLYEFTLDQPFMALLNADVTLLDAGAVAYPNSTFKANVRANTTGPRAGIDPGTDPTLTPLTIYLRFRTASSGALADPPASSGFWLQLFLKNTGIY